MISMSTIVFASYKLDLDIIDIVQELHKKLQTKKKQKKKEYKSSLNYRTMDN